MAPAPRTSGIPKTGRMRGTISAAAIFTLICGRQSGIFAENRIASRTDSPDAKQEENRMSGFEVAMAGYLAFGQIIPS